VFVASGDKHLTCIANVKVSKPFHYLSPRVREKLYHATDNCRQLSGLSRPFALYIINICSDTKGCSIGINRFCLDGLGGFSVFCSFGEKPFSVDQPFQPTSIRVEMVEKAFA